MKISLRPNRVAPTPSGPEPETVQPAAGPLPPPPGGRLPTLTVPPSPTAAKGSSPSASGVARVHDGTASMHAQLASLSLGQDGSGTATVALTNFVLSAHGHSSASTAPQRQAERPTIDKDAAAAQKQRARVNERGCWQQMRSSLGTIVISLGTVFVVVFLNAAFMSVFEADAEMAALEARSQDSAALRKLQVKYNMSDADFQTIERSLSFDLIANPKDVSRRNWGVKHIETSVYAFTIVTSIGYGNFAPTTVGGKAWTMITAILGLPAIGFCLVACASQWLSFTEGLMVKGMQEVKEAFGCFDLDNSGLLSLHEFRSALTALGIEMTDSQFNAHVNEIDDGSGSISLEEFGQSAAKLDLPIGRVSRARKKLFAVVAVATVWLMLGALAFHRLEGWTYFDALYFCVITLTTVGLGDFVPSTQGGLWFLIVFCTNGLGVVSILVSAISDLTAKIRNAEAEAADALPAAAAAQLESGKKGASRVEGASVAENKYRVDVNVGARSHGREP